MRLRYLKEISLLYATREKADNGVLVNEYQTINNYKVEKQELIDEISSNIYGANINQMYRISSPLKSLEKYLQTKINNDSDNISKYYILLNDVKYKIKAVKDNWIDIERL